MKNVVFFITGTLLILCSFILPGIVCASSSGLNILKDVRVTDSASGTDIEFQFDKLFDKKFQPVFYRKSIQIDFPALMKVKKNILIKNELLKEVRLYPFSRGVLRARLVLAREGLDLRDGFIIKNDGKNVFIHIARKEIVKSSKVQDNVDKSILLAIADAAENPEIRENIANVEQKIDLDSDSDAVVMSNEDVPEAEAEGNDLLPSEMDQTPVAVSEGPTERKTSFNDNGDMLQPLIKMGGAFAIVLALIFFSAVGAKKILSKNNRLFGGDKLIKVLSSGQIDVKKSIKLVDVAGEILVLGITADNISMLTKLEDDEAVNRVRNVNSSQEKKTSFMMSLKGVFSKKDTDSRSGNFSKKLKESQKDYESIDRAEIIANVARSIRQGG